MSDLDDKQPEMAEMLNKMTRYNKNVKALMELMNKAIEKLDILVKNKPAENNDADAEKRGLLKSLRLEKLEDVEEFLKPSNSSILKCCMKAKSRCLRLKLSSFARLKGTVRCLK